MCVNKDKCRELVFIDTVKALMPLCGINLIPEAVKYISLMEERIIAELEVRAPGANLKKSLLNEKKEAFIKIFCEMFQAKYDRKYNIEFNVKELTMIGHLTEELEKEQIPIRLYLEWCFGELLDNDSNMIPSVALFCSQKVSMRFFINKKEDIAKYKEQQLKDDEVIVLRDMFKKCIRELREIGDAGKTIMLQLKEKGEAFKSNMLHIDDFRKFLFQKEQEIGSLKKLDVESKM